MSRGQRALDVGCGPGALTTELVALLGADRVAAVEPSDRFADACRDRHRGVDVTVAAAVWDYAAEMMLLRRFCDAAVALDPSAESRDEGRCMPFCTPGDLGALWSTAGLADVDVIPHVVAARYDGFDDLWAPLQLGVAPSGAYVASLSPARGAEGRAAAPPGCR